MYGGWRGKRNFGGPPANRDADGNSHEPGAQARRAGPMPQLRQDQAVRQLSETGRVPAPIAAPSFGRIRADDAAPWGTIIVVGHIFMPLIFFVNLDAFMPFWAGVFSLGGPVRRPVAGAAAALQGIVHRPALDDARAGREQRLSLKGPQRAPARRRAWPTIPAEWDDDRTGPCPALRHRGSGHRARCSGPA